MLLNFPKWCTADDPFPRILKQKDVSKSSRNGRGERRGAMTQLHQLLDPMETGGEAVVLEAGLRERIVGQEEAIHTIVDAYQAWLAGMNTPGRPVANLLFLGPTGTGKTRMV